MQTTDAPKLLRMISAYAIEWRRYGPRGKLGEDKKSQLCFLPGCFDASLAGDHEIILTQDCQHQPIFARRSDGTLRLHSDDIGLRIDADLLDTPENRLLCHKIDAGRVRGWSHCWETVPGGYRVRQQGGVVVYEYFAGHLSEISLVINKLPRMRKTTKLFERGGPNHVSAHAVPLT